MAKTAEDIISRALLYIGVKNSEVAITDTQFNDGVVDLNQMMWTLEAKGFPFGYAPVKDRTDPITAPDVVWQMMETRLAIQISPQYGKPVSPALAVLADDSWKSVANLETRTPKVMNDATLPLGGGNWHFGSRYGHRKFVGNPRHDDILTGSGGALKDSETGLTLTRETPQTAPSGSSGSTSFDSETITWDNG